MATPFAFVTLVTSDHYLPGALAVAAALKDLHPSPPVHPEVDFQTVCLVTPETVDVSSIKLLRRAFGTVIGVELIEQEDDKGLRLLGRPDLSHVLTKLHLFRLTQFVKLIFLDADVLPIRPISHLFNLPHDFAAVPDVGWPDIFNSGVLVTTPGVEKFTELMDRLKTKGSWDGGDQGLLNEWRGGDWHRLSFTYNTTPTAAYTYAPAYERFGSQISAIHFIGPNKPWASLPFRAPGVQSAQKPDLDSISPSKQTAYDYASLLDRWYDVYDRHYRSDRLDAQADFEVRRYASAWNAEQTFGAEFPSVAGAPPPPSSGGVLGLEELRQIAVGGISAFTSRPNPDERPHEGEYRSMPLEGRVDLMRVRRDPVSDAQDEVSQQDRGGAQSSQQTRSGGAQDDQAERNDDGDLTPKQEFGRHVGSGETRTGTLPTPGPDEIPPAPYHHGHSLPPTPLPYLPPSQQHLFDQEQESESERDEQQQQQRQLWQQHQQQQQQYYQSEQDEPQQPLVQFPLRPRFQQPHQGQPSSSPGQPTQSTQSTSTQQPRQQLQPQQPHSPVPHHPHHHHEHPTHHHRTSPQQHIQQHHPHHSPPRPPSPPKLSWNPAIEPPPTNPPPPSAFPVDTYFPNIWDQPPSQLHDATHQSFPLAHPHTSPRSDAFFNPPPPPVIPERLIREGQYAGVIGLGHDHPHGSPHIPPTPDRTKVQAVFPWEGRPRHAPRRVFPASDTPPPSAQYIEPEVPPAPSVAMSPPPPMRVAMHASPPVGLPFNLSYSNAWDSVPSIQKYASRLVRPPQRSALHQAYPVDTEQWERERERVVQAQQDASSMDGDDEDEGEEEDHVETAGRWDDSEEGRERSGSTARRSRASSSASAGQVTSFKGKKYRSRGMQTVAIETRTQGVQVNIGTRSEEVKPRDGKASRGSGLGSRREAASGTTLPTLLPPAPGSMRELRADADQMAVSTPSLGHSLRATPFPAVISPSDLQSPQALGSPRTYSPPKGSTPPKMLSPPKVQSPPRVGTPSKVTSPPKSMSPRKLSLVQQHSSSTSSSRRTSGSTASSKPGSPVVGPMGTLPPYSTSSPKLPRLSSPFAVPLARTSSNDTAATSSPSTQGTVITPESTPILSPSSIRKGGRVWDPARGVDVFKRDSEEVLARFLRMGSFDQDERERRPGSVQ